MDIGPVVRIPVLPATAEVPRVEAAKLVRPVRPELPSIAVDEAPPAPPPQTDPQRRPPSEAVERRTTIDSVTGQVVFQAVDAESGGIVRQVPEEIMLRLQIYARIMRQEAAGERPQADTTA